MKMMGKFVRDLYDWYEDRKSVGDQRSSEKQAWRRELPDELHPLPDDNDEDPSGQGDCRHGCNGHCLASEGKCTLTCHSQEVYEYWQKWEPNP